jgi:hypothetical protein
MFLTSLSIPPGQKVYYFFNLHFLKRYNNVHMQRTSATVYQSQNERTELKTSTFWVDQGDKTHRHEHITGWS